MSEGWRKQDYENSECFARLCIGKKEAASFIKIRYSFGAKFE